MEKRADPSLPKLPLLLVALSLAGAALVFAATVRSGLGLSPDSASYLSAARSLMSGSGAWIHTGEPLVNQPPLYPALLAVLGWISRGDPLAAARILHCLLFAGIVYLSCVLFRPHLAGFRPLMLAGGAAVLVSGPLLDDAVMLWSESAFVLLTLSFVIGMESYLRDGSRRWLAVAALSAALAWITRYIGFTLVLTGALVLLISRRRTRVPMRHLLFFLAVTMIPILSWGLRNQLVSGTPFGPRAPSAFSLGRNLGLTFYTLLFWCIPPRVTEHRPLLMLLSGGAGLLLGLGMRGGAHRIRQEISALLVPLVFTVLYAGSLVLLSTRTAYDPIGNRLLSPLYIPIGLILLVAARLVRDGLARSFSSRWAAALVLVPVFLWFVHPLRSAARDTRDRAQNGVGGYSAAAWQDSPLLRYVRSNATGWDRPIVSNAPDALYLLAGVESQEIPAKTAFNSPKVVNRASELRGRWPERESATLVYLTDTPRGHLFTLDELAGIAELDTLAVLEDGLVCAVRSRAE